MPVVGLWQCERRSERFLSLCDFKLGGSSPSPLSPIPIPVPPLLRISWQSEARFFGADPSSSAAVGVNQNQLLVAAAAARSTLQSVH